MARALFTVGLAEEIEGHPLAGVEALQAVDQIAAPLIELQLSLLRGEDLDLQLATLMGDANGEIAQLWQCQAQQRRPLRAAQLLIDIHRQPLQQLTQLPMTVSRCQPGELQIPGGHSKGGDPYGRVGKELAFGCRFTCSDWLYCRQLLYLCVKLSGQFTDISSQGGGKFGCDRLVVRCQWQLMWRGISDDIYRVCVSCLMSLNDWMLFIQPLVFCRCNLGNMIMGLGNGG